VQSQEWRTRNNDRLAAGYYRVSVGPDNMHSPELYEEEIRRYCTYKKLELARIYSDADYSAFRGARERPSLNELVDNRKDYSAVLVPKLSRFGRSMKELVRPFALFDADGIPLVFLDMNLGTSTSQGRLLRHILAAFAGPVACGRHLRSSEQVPYVRHRPRNSSKWLYQKECNVHIVLFGSQVRCAVVRGRLNEDEALGPARSCCGHGCRGRCGTDLGTRSCA
jgi:hypothetical protein